MNLRYKIIDILITQFIIIYFQIPISRLIMFIHIFTNINEEMERDKNSFHSLNIIYEFI